MATEQPFFCPISASPLPLDAPYSGGSNEASSYNRAEVCFEWAVSSFIWNWRFDDDNISTYAGRVRGVVDGVANSGWVSKVGTVWPIPVNASNGDHLFSVQFESAAPNGTIVLAKPFLVNTTASALPGPRRPWIAPNRFEYTHNGAGPMDVPRQIEVPPSTWRPYRAAIKPRTIASSSTTLTAANLWCRDLWAPNVRNVFFRDFKKTAKGDVYVAAWEKYPYGDGVSLGSYRAGLSPPTSLVRDGPRNRATQGYICQIRLREDGKGMWLYETSGRVSFVQFKEAGVGTPGNHATAALHPGEGQCDTLMGWRLPADAMQIGRTAGGLEHVGNFSRAKGFTRAHELWGGAVAIRNLDGSISNRNGLDHWFTSTLDHWIGFRDDWAAHSDVSAQTGRPSEPHFPPDGYVFPGHVGESQVVHLYGNENPTNPQPTPTVNQPWFIGIRPQDGRLYWSNFGGHSIATGTTSGSESHLLIQGDTPEAACGVNTLLSSGVRLMPATQSLATIRSFMRDGPMGVATCFCPQAADFDSEGNLIIVERYTYAVRKYNFQNQTYTTLCLIPDGKLTLGSGSSGTQDFSLAVDSRGSMGPKDTIYISGWGGPSTYVVSPSGAFLGRLAGVDLSQKYMRNGQFSLVDPINYGWPIDVLDRFVLAGNSSGSQFTEITKRLPTDPIWTSAQQAAILRGEAIYKHYLHFTHGPSGRGQLGYPNVEELGSWSDAALVAYLQQWGAAANETSDFIAWVRARTVDFDYTTQPPEDPAVIAELQAQLLAAQAAVAAAIAEAAALQTQIDDLNATIAARDGTIASLQSKIAAGRSAAAATVTALA